MAKENLTKEAFEIQVNELFEKIEGEINEGVKWQKKGYEYLIDTIKKSVAKNEAYAKTQGIKLDSKKLISTLSEYALEGLKEDGGNKAQAMQKLNTIINSIDNETFKDHLSSWPSKIQDLLALAKKDRDAKTNFENGDFQTALKPFLKGKITLKSNLRDLKYGSDSYVTSFLWTIRDSYFPQFDRDKHQDKLQEMKGNLLKSFEEKK